MSKPHLRAVVEGDTGQIFAQPCPRCEEVQLADLENAERRIRKLEREKRALEEDQMAKREADPQRQVILGLIDLWRRATGHPKANIYAADRFDVVKARLREGYEPKDIELAIKGIGAFPYVVEGQRMRYGTRGQKHDRLGIACGSGENLERMANLGHQARKEQETK